jgi:sulfide:quinone oxidoreductase
MSKKILVLGAGFGGLELCSILSKTIGDDIELTLIDKNDSFVFGFSKLDVLFGRATFDEVRIPYRTIADPAIRFRKENIVSIDPATRRVVTDRGTYDPDILVVALGADYDLDATPGLSEGGNEFYSPEGVERLRRSIPAFTEGHAVIGVVSVPFKCPPAPSETALLLHDYLTERGVRDACEITLVMPLPVPIPPSPDASRALLAAFSQQDIEFVPGRRVASLDPARRVVVLDDGVELPCDLFLGIPKHKVPDVLKASGMAEDGWVHVDPANLRTKFQGVYAVGDSTDIDVPMAGVFAEGAARVAAASIIADVKGGDAPQAYDGAGSCYIEFGAGLVGRVDVNFLSGPTPTGSFTEPSTLLASEKEKFASSRRLRWFGQGTGP